MLCGILLGIDDEVKAIVAVVFVFIASAALNERYGLHLMSDRYVLANLIQEFRHGTLNSAN